MVWGEKQTHRPMKHIWESINKTTYVGGIIFDKGTKNTQWRKENPFNKWCWATWKATCTRMKWIKNTSKCKTWNNKELRRKHRWIRPQRQEKAKINEWDYIKLKIFCTAKGTDNKTKRQPTKWGIFANNSSDNGLMSKIYKEYTTHTHTTQH